MTPGQTLYVYVGGMGNTFNGGGVGGTTGAGNGGGASDVRAGGNALVNRVLTAGGGGAGGSSDTSGVTAGSTTNGVRVGDGEVTVCFQAAARETVVPGLSPVGRNLFVLLLGLSALLVLRRLS